MNTPSPNSMKRDPGRGSAYLSFLKKRCRDFFFFCLLLGVYVAFITLTGIGCPIRFFIGISCPGLRNEPRGTVNALRSFSGGVSDASACLCRATRRCLALLRAGTDGGTSAF